MRKYRCEYEEKLVIKRGYFGAKARSARLDGAGEDGCDLGAHSGNAGGARAGCDLLPADVRERATNGMWKNRFQTKKRGVIDLSDERTPKQRWRRGTQRESEGEVGRGREGQPPHHSSLASAATRAAAAISAQRTVATIT